MYATFALSTGGMPENSIPTMRMLSDGGGAACQNWLDCLTFARNKFEKYFNHKARQLIVNLPLDAKNSDGRPFWSFPKSAPQPLTFDSNDSVHLGFIACLAIAWAKVTGVDVSPRNLDPQFLKSDITMAEVRKFVPKQGKSIVTDENVTAEQAEEEQAGKDSVDPAAFAAMIVQAPKTALHPDNLDDTLKDCFINLSAALRCKMFGIPVPDEAFMRQRRSKTCPCPTPAVDAVSDLACMEFAAMAASISGEDANYHPHDWYVSTSPDFDLVRSESRPPRRMRECDHIKVRADGKTCSLWDFMEVRGKKEWLLRDFMEHMKNNYGAVITLVVQGARMVYMKAMVSHQKRLDNL